MSQPYGPYATSGKHTCDNCKKVHPAAKLKAIPDLFERIEPGCPFPSGECPDCGALCYPRLTVIPQSQIPNLQSSILYIDPFSGIAGDMFLGALLDLGLDLERLKAELAKLRLPGYRLNSQRVMRGPIAAVKFEVELDALRAARVSKRSDRSLTVVARKQPGHSAHAHEHRTLTDIQALIKDAPFSQRVKADSLKVFQKLAEAEGRIHNLPPEKVSFHEVGALDSLVDVLGVCLALEMLGVAEVWCGPVAVGGGGCVQCRHGLLPLPAPAALELLKGIPLREVVLPPLKKGGRGGKELTTPTGAALLAALSSGFGPLPSMTITRIGYGAGTRDEAGLPNVLRVLLGTKEAATAATPSSDSILEIQTNLDDTSPEILGYLSESLLAGGALDVFFTPIQMKKCRPATLLTVLAEPPQLDALVPIIFQECSAFGLRYRAQARLKLRRRMVKVETPYGRVNVKVGSWLGREVSVHPEFEDCQSLAKKKHVPLKEIMEAARLAYRKQRLSATS